MIVTYSYAGGALDLLISTVIGSKPRFHPMTLKQQQYAENIIKMKITISN